MRVGQPWTASSGWGGRLADLVQPNNANTVYLGAIDIYRGDHGAGGWAWTDISSKAAAGTDSIHPDQHALAFDPVDPNMIYAGNDGCLFRSPDRGTHWVHRNHSLALHR